MTSRYRAQVLYRCPCPSASIDPASVPPYVPKCCPTPPNTDPRRFNAYCPPPKSLSQPLSHEEYLRQKKANNTAALSSPANLVQVQAGEYTRTIWTATASPSPCCQGENLVLPPVPAAMPGGTALDAGFVTDKKGAAAARGTLSHYDEGLREDSLTTLRRAGQAISNEACATCSALSGTTIYPGKGCGC